MKCGWIIALLLLFSVDSPAADVIFVGGDTSGIYESLAQSSRKDGEMSYWMDLRKKELREKGYRVHEVDRIQLDVLLEMISSPSTVAIVYFGHSVGVAEGRILYAFQGTRRIPIDADAVRSVELLHRRKFKPGANFKLFFAASCQSNRCGVSTDPLGVKPYLVGFNDDVRLRVGRSVFEGQQILVNDVDDAFSDASRVGRFLKALPAVKLEGLRSDWNLRNQRDPRIMQDHLLTVALANVSDYVELLELVSRFKMDHANMVRFLPYLLQRFGTSPERYLKLIEIGSRYHSYFAWEYLVQTLDRFVDLIPSGIDREKLLKAVENKIPYPDLVARFNQRIILLNCERSFWAI